MNTELPKITKVKECRSDEESNKYLALGWILLNVHTHDHGHPDIRDQNTVYSLGWSKDKGEPQHPKGKYESLAEK